MALPAREIKVEENLHYVKFEDTYVLANKGLTNWEQALNPTTDDSVQYIAESSSTSQVTGYAPTVSYEGKAYPGDDFAYWLYKVGKEQKVGATFEEVEVETWNEDGDGTGTYKAYHRTYEVQPDNPGSGEAGSKLTVSGTFAQQGDQEVGTFNIKTKEFTATAATE
jgi:hypothetical protein